MPFHACSPPLASHGVTLNVFPSYLPRRHPQMDRFYCSGGRHDLLVLVGRFPTFLPLILHFRQLPPTSTGAISISCCPIASIRIFRTPPTPYAYYTSIEMSRENIDDCNLIDKI